MSEGYDTLIATIDALTGHVHLDANMRGVLRQIVDRNNASWADGSSSVQAKLHPNPPSPALPSSLSCQDTSRRYERDWKNGRDEPGGVWEMLDGVPILPADVVHALHSLMTFDLEGSLECRQQGISCQTHGVLSLKLTSWSSLTLFPVLGTCVPPTLHTYRHQCGHKGRSDRARPLQHPKMGLPPHLSVDIKSKVYLVWGPGKRRVFRFAHYVCASPPQPPHLTNPLLFRCCPPLLN